MIPLLITSIHLAALGMLETGADNFATGSHGEVSQYQVMPAIWFKAAGTADPTDPAIAYRVAKKLWQQRVAQFEKKNQRNPTIQELSLLWHSPKNALSPNAEQLDYSERFVNLIHAHEASQAQKTHPR